MPNDTSHLKQNGFANGYGATNLKAPLDGSGQVETGDVLPTKKELKYKNEAVSYVPGNTIIKVQYYV